MTSDPFPTKSSRFYGRDQRKRNSVIVRGRSVTDILALGLRASLDVFYTWTREGRVQGRTRWPRNRRLHHPNKEHPRTGDKHHELNPEQTLRSPWTREPRDRAKDEKDTHRCRLFGAAAFPAA